MTQAQHDDPFGEIRTQTAQVLAVAATVGEAAARWYAVGLQKKASIAEADNRTEAGQLKADQLANRAQEKQDKQLIDQGLTSWLQSASVEETVRLWRTATIYAAGGNARAAQAAALAQERLRQLNTPLMDAYDRHRGNGMAQADAMRAAAYDVWTAETNASTPESGEGSTENTARPHGTRDRANLVLLAAGDVIDELDAAVRAEAGRLAAHISPDALENLQRVWRENGLIPAADAAGLLAQAAWEAVGTGAMPVAAAERLITSVRALADEERRAAELENAQPDDPLTPSVDEHGQGQDRADVHTGHADADLAAAADQQHLMGQAFPPLTHIGAAPGHSGTPHTAPAFMNPRKPRTR